jgi:hypothetical protein
MAFYLTKKPLVQLKAAVLRMAADKADIVGSKQH